MLNALRRVAAFFLSVTLCFSLAACSGDANAGNQTISPDEMAVIRRQAEGFEEARERLPDLAQLVDDQNWVFTRNLIHGPMQEVGKEMEYINIRLPRKDQQAANRLAKNLKNAFEDLDEGAKQQNASRMQSAYANVVQGFADYAEVIPSQALS
ncbi:MAG: photosystem II protein PsbQ [Prochlorococcus sp.]|nr:photosystem II protein PsbQ [Prochlorococcaceae cyanobacterium Fu_MAG_50]